MIVIILVVFVILYYLTTWNFNYWKNRRVPYLKPVPLFGNYKDHILLKKGAWEVVKTICDKFPDAPYIGTFYGTEPALVVQDLDIIKLIFTEKFQHFHGREVSKYFNNESLTQTLFWSSGDHWKLLRQNLIKLFSPVTMKNMFPSICVCNERLQDMLDKEIGERRNNTNTCQITVRYAMECLGAATFGVNFNIMENDSKNKEIHTITQAVFDSSKKRSLELIVHDIWPKIFYMLRLTIFKKEIQDFFLKIVSLMSVKPEYKQRCKQNFIDLIVNLTKDSYLYAESMYKTNTIKLKVDQEFLSSSAFLLFSGGFETTSNVISHFLYEIAKNKDAQKRLHVELDSYFRERVDMRHNCTADLPYLNACLNEIFRLYPSFPIVTREVMQDCLLSTGLRLEKGLRIHIPVQYIHRNPVYFSNPEKFMPERFLPPNQHDIEPYTFMPFGVGPRMCLGMRFAKMALVTGLVTILKNYELDIAEGMNTSLKYKVKTFLLSPDEKILLDFNKR